VTFLPFNCQTFLHTSILLTKGDLRKVTPSLSFFSAAAFSSKSPIFHALTIHNDTAAPMYMRPVKSIAPV